MRSDINDMDPTGDTSLETFYYQNISRSYNDTFVDLNLTSELYPFLKDYEAEEGLERNRKHNVLVAVILLSFCVATVLGNALIIVAVARERYLHSVTNYFITSLAVADFLVGLVVMPFQAIFELMNKQWIFGGTWCDFWRSLDVLASTSSILNLCVISLDRYLAITDPFTYPSRMTTNKACILIALVWICSSLISFPAILWWRASRSGPIPDLQCPFTEDIGYLVFSSFISFYGPLIVMVFAYYRIYRAAVQQTKSLKMGSKLCTDGDMELTLRMHRGGRKSAASSTSTYTNAPGKSSTSVHGNNHHLHHHHHSHGHLHHHVLHHHNNHVRNVTMNEPEFSTNEALLPVGVANNGKKCCSDPNNPPSHSASNPSDPCSSGNGASSNPNSNPRTTNSVRVVPRHLKHFSISRKLAKFAKEKKAAKTLGIVMGVFVVCWFPFFVTNLISGFCSSCLKQAEIVTDIFTWLGWINSSMNPFIYACMSKEMRRAFGRVICACCAKRFRRPYRSGGLRPRLTRLSQMH